MANDIIKKIQADLSAGKYASAQKRIRPLAKKEPANAGLQNMAGICFAQAGQHRAAAPFFQAAVRAGPENPEFRYNLLLALIFSDEIDKATPMLDRMIDKYPDQSRFLYLRALGHQRQRRYAEAEAAATDAIKQSPKSVEALKLRGAVLSHLHRDAEALKDFKTVLKINPNDLIAHKSCAKRLTEVGKNDEALEHHDAVLRLAPNDPYTLSKVAAICDKGMLPALLTTAQDGLSNRNQSTRDRALLTLTQAVSQERLGLVQDALTSFTQLHAIDAKERPYHSKNAWSEFQKICALFSQTQSSTDIPTISPAPIFVVGLPRSGTTLVEMILSASSDVISCGELDFAERLFQEHFVDAEAAAPEKLHAFADGYRNALPEMPASAQAFVDKMPSNFRYVGPLLDAFPNAVVIHVTRDPRDVALSMWKRRFTSAGMNYATRLEGIADQANLYARYMAHWSGIYGAQILTISYETLVQDLEQASRQMAEHCGISWVVDMCQPEKNTARVQTASAHQVREKVHHRSIGAWTQFGDRITPLTDRLDPQLWPDIT